MPSVYGPVPSWRLGRSLGIDPLYPPKTCTFDCVYCQLGRTINKISEPERLENLVKVDTVLQDLKALESTHLESLDYITFSGSGEPTLNLSIGIMIDGIRNLAEGIPIAVLTNSSLIGRKDVRNNLSKADLVVAKLDAPNQKIFEAINRPTKDIKLSSIVKGLKLLRGEASNRLALQIMFFKTDHGHDNTNEESVKGLVRLTSKIMPDEVQINTPTRPPSEKYVHPLGARELTQISKKFKETFPRVQVAVRIGPRQTRSVEKRKIRKEEVLELVKRRPCSINDISNVLCADEDSVIRLVMRLVTSNKIISTHFDGNTYYKANTS
ncbi:MAG: radical SAM protein [Nitrososphaerales archaeon]